MLRPWFRNDGSLLPFLHTGPLFFESEHMDFYNLELADTNVVDHNNHDYRAHSGVEFEVLASA